MGRLYAQLCTAVFAVIGIGGLFVGSAGIGNSSGNLGSVALHLTWARDVLDIALLAVFVWVGFVAARRPGRLALGIACAVLLVLGIAGAIYGDDAGATKGFLGMHWSTALNVLDLVVGGLGVLAALGTVEDDEPERSVLRS